MKTEKTLASDVDRMVESLARSILEAIPENRPLGLIGIRTRGVPLARRIEASLRSMAPDRLIHPTGSLDISFHRDDLSRRLPTPQLTEVSFSLEGSVVILVDDVLFTGRTVRAALHALRDFGRPEAVRLAVLVDRGHREVPIQADFIARQIETQRQDHVYVRLLEIDGEDAIRLVSEAEA